MSIYDIPWLPPEPYTYSAQYGWRASYFAWGLPPLPDPSEQEMRWKAEDRWLTKQWELTE